MNGPELKEFVRKAEELYAAKLRSMLEPEHTDKFVAIEPESGEFFLGKLSRRLGKRRAPLTQTV